MFSLNVYQSNICKTLKPRFLEALKSVCYLRFGESLYKYKFIYKNPFKIVSFAKMV